MRARWLIGFVALFACTAGATSAAAQECTTATIGTGSSGQKDCIVGPITGQNATGFVAPTLMRLTVSPTTFSVTPTLADLDDGRTASQTMTLQVVANRSWRIEASGPATFTGTGSLARQNKPVSDVRWSTVNSGAGTALTTSGATITSGSAGPASGSNIKTLYWWTNLSWTADPPGSYSLAITLTLTAP
jgi:hypothetical protein